MTSAEKEAMTNGPRWLAVLIAIVVTVAIIGLGAYARGPHHHHGDEIGTHGTPPVRSQ
jgi:hypothetical protein